MSKKHAKDEYLQGTNYKLALVFVVIFALLAVAIGCGTLYYFSQVQPSEEPVVIVNVTPTLEPVMNTTVVPTVEQESKSDLKIHFQNIGQGDSILLEHNGQYALIDAGKTKIALDEIKKHLCERYDWVLTTHQDNDHIGYVSYVIENSAVNWFYDNGNVVDTQAYKNMMNSVTNNNLFYHILSTGDTIDFWNDVNITVVSSKVTNGKNVNDDSVVLLLEFEGVKVAFTGDISEDVEDKIGKALGDVDILKVAHHGSKTSSSDVFLCHVLPEISVISVGENSYGHPSDEAIERLQKYGTVYRTDEYGCVEIVIDDGKYEIKHCEY